MSNNEGINSSNAVMKIECVGYTELTLYIRSSCEDSFFEYTIASNANLSTYPTSYDSSYAKADTMYNSNSGTTLSNYTAVNYTGLSGNNNIIYIVFARNPSMTALGPKNRGYVLIPKQ